VLVNTSSVLLGTSIDVGGHIVGKVAGVSLDLDVIWSTLIAGAIVVALGLWARKRATSGVPGKLQLAWETIVTAVSNQVESSLGSSGARIVPLAVALFVFILVANLLELIPSGEHPPLLPAPTADVNLTYALAFLVIILVHAAALKTKGIRGYIRRYFRPYKVLLPINVIEEIAKPVTLALRLFGNVFSGGIMLALIAGLFAPYIIPVPDVIWKLFDIFVGFIQAFIFALLTILYFEMAMGDAH